MTTHQEILHTVKFKGHVYTLTLYRYAHTRNLYIRSKIIYIYQNYVGVYDYQNPTYKSYAFDDDILINLHTGKFKNHIP